MRVRVRVQQDATRRAGCHLWVRADFAGDNHALKKRHQKSAREEEERRRKAQVGVNVLDISS